MSQTPLRRKLINTLISLALALCSHGDLNKTDNLNVEVRNNIQITLLEVHIH